MNFTDEKDYIMRMIKEMVRVLFSLAFGKKYVSVELEKENKYEVSGKNLKIFLNMIDLGQINEAENILLDSIDYTNKNEVMAVALFYQYLSEKDNQFLENNNYTKVGQSLYDVWNELSTLIDEKYEMECLWNKGGKAWKYEYKYRRGGKTLCALYARENCVGFMIILGKDERLKFDTDRDNYSKEVQRIYDETKTYHDGKWLMFEPTDTTLFDDFIRLLRIKRKPNRK